MYYLAAALMTYNIWIVFHLAMNGHTYTVDQVRNVVLNGIYATFMAFVLLQFK